jgi:hypothetical protein
MKQKGLKPSDIAHKILTDIWFILSGGILLAILVIITQP